MTSPLRVSVAVPLYNEALVVPEFLRRVLATLDGIPGGPHEAVFADDGSTDRTRELLEEAAALDGRIVVVALSRNFGHQAALSAALDHVSGNVVVLMDGDLQDPPEVIPRFLEHYQAGFDVVYARRLRRKEPAWLRAAYHVFYRMLSRISDVQLPVDAGDFSLVSSRVAKQLQRMPERHRYMRGLRSWAGFKQIGIDVERGSRHAGESKYSVWTLLKLAFDGMFSFSIVPLRAATVIGGVAVALSSMFALFAVLVRVTTGVTPQGFTALLVVLTFLVGVNLFFLGIIGEYVGRIYEQVKARPMYIVDYVVRGTSKSGAKAGEGGPPARQDLPPDSRASET